MDLKDVSTQSAEIRSRYHDLERQIHAGGWPFLPKEWS